MSRRITIGLSESEISNLASELDKIASKLQKIGDKLTDDVAEVALSEMQKNYSQSQYQATDGMGFFKTGTDNEKQVGMIGTQAIYTEFGTGTMGKQSPHPQKYQFGDGLKDYNSGRTIKRNTNPKSKASQNGIPLDGLYWTYKDENGEIQYTQGIPAQKIVFDANKTVKEKLPSLCKKAVEEVLK